MSGLTQSVSPRQHSNRLKSMPLEERLCRLMCGRTLPFRRSLNNWAAPSIGRSPTHFRKLSKGHKLSAHQRAQPAEWFGVSRAETSFATPKAASNRRSPNKFRRGKFLTRQTIDCYFLWNDGGGKPPFCIDRRHSKQAFGDMVNTF
jgi:hypothetical protein